MEAAQQRIVAAATQIAGRQGLSEAQVAALSARHWDGQIQAMQRLEAVAELLEAALPEAAPKTRASLSDTKKDKTA